MVSIQDLLLKLLCFQKDKQTLRFIQGAAAAILANFHVTVRQAQSCLASVQDRQRKYADLKRQDVSFAVGDEVLLSTANLKLRIPPAANDRKLMPKFVGPFKVKKQINAHAVAYAYQL